MLLNNRRRVLFAYSRLLLLKQLAAILLTVFLSIATWGQTFVQQGSKLVANDAANFSTLGRSVALSADGNTAVLGGYGDDNGKGAAWVYSRSNGVWSQQGTKLVGVGAIGASGQGQCVDISSDGNTIVVGGFRDNNGLGAVWVYKHINGTWVQEGQKLVGSGSASRAYQGYGVAISGDGNTIISGGYLDNLNAQGAAWIFTYQNGVWVQQGNKLTGTTSSVTFSSQAASVGLSYDGNTAIIGGSNDNNATGGAWIFKRNGNAWTQQGNKLVGTGSVGFARQGTFVSISADGKTVILGGPSDNRDQSPQIQIMASVRRGYLLSLITYGRNRE